MKLQEARESNQRERERRQGYVEVKQTDHLAKVKGHLVAAEDVVFYSCIQLGLRQRF